MNTHQRPSSKRYSLCGILAIITLINLLVSCGSENDNSNDTTQAFIEQAESYTLIGTILDEEGQPIESALVTVDGIEADILTNEDGDFTVNNDAVFDNIAVVTASKDGYEPFNATLDIASGSDTNYELDESVVLAELEPWGYLEVNVEAVEDGGSNAPSSTIPQFMKSGDESCDCVIAVKGRTHKKGSLKSELFIMLVVDASGSTGDRYIGHQSVFEVEINAMTTLLDAITEVETTHVGIIRFAAEASLLLDFTTDLALAKSTLANMTPESSGESSAATDYEAALTLVNETFSAAETKKRDVLTAAFMSDGIPTAPFGSGTTQEKEDRIASIEAANLVAAENIIINTFPVNIRSPLTTMPAISAITGGTYFVHDDDAIERDIANDNLVGIIDLEVLNTTTDEAAHSFSLKPDGHYAGEICLTGDEANEIKITPTVCKDCENIAYQKIKANCESQECSACAGQITMLTLRYTGELADATVRVEQPRKSKGNHIIYDGLIESDETFEFFGVNKDKTMGSEINIYVDDELNATFVTSCGQPKTKPGLVSGDFTVVKGYSRNGGLLCADD